MGWAVGHVWKINVTQSIQKYKYLWCSKQYNSKPSERRYCVTGCVQNVGSIKNCDHNALNVMAICERFKIQRSEGACERQSYVRCLTLLFRDQQMHNAFCWCQRSEKENAGSLEHHKHWRVPEMFSAVGKKVGKGVSSPKDRTLKETNVVMV